MTKTERNKELRRKRLERLQGYVEAKLGAVRKEAVDRLGRMVADDATTWDQRTVADVTALKIAEWTEAESRARKSAPVINQSFGVVYLPQPATDGSDWKARMEARRAATAIEAKEVPALPAKPGPEAA